MQKTHLKHMRRSQKFIILLQYYDCYEYAIVSGFCGYEFFYTHCSLTEKYPDTKIALSEDALQSHGTRCTWEQIRSALMIK